MVTLLYILHLLLPPTLPAQDIFAVQDLFAVQEVVLQRSYVLGTPISDTDAYLIAESAVQESYQIPLPIILSIIEIESRYDKNAKSKKNCRGLMQLSWGTAKTMAQRIKKNKFYVFDIKDNIQIAVAYLAALVKENSSMEKALTIYNRGWKGFVRNDKQTSSYARNVIRNSNKINELLKDKLSCKKN